MNNSEKISILLVEDDDIDRRAVKRLFKQERISNPIVEAKHGQHALDILLGKDENTSIRKPFLILLDLNMPVMGGHEFLEKVRSNPKLSDSIVFVLTTSSDDKDKAKAYDSHVAGYLLKKNIAQEFMSHIKMLGKFLVSVEFPAEEAH